MQHTYNIIGMSCDGCRSKVENALNQVTGVSASVTLEPAQAVITMQEHVSTEKLQEALSAAGSGCCTTRINADFAFIKLLKCVN